jgi:hypothetical protein
VSVKDFRKILHCFNSNGALQPIDQLANRLSDADLRPIVDVGNRYVLNNPKLLYQLEQTFYTLGNRKILDSTFTQFGRLLENDEFVSSSIALLKEGYTAERGPHGIAGDRSLLLALQQLSTRVTDEGMASFLDVVLTLARSKAFVSLQRHLRGDSPAGRNLRDLTDQLVAFLQDRERPDAVQIGERFLGELADNDLFQVMDRITGTDPGGFVFSVPRMTSVLHETLKDGAGIMDGMTTLFNVAHRPLTCMKKAQTVPDLAYHALREALYRPDTEAASFIQRTAPLMVALTAPLCDFDPAIGARYDAIYKLAGSQAIEPATQLMRAAWDLAYTDAQGNVTRPAADLLIDLLADPGVKLLLPALAELDDRGVWNDLVLLSAMPRQEDRASFESDVKFLLDDIPGTDESIYATLSTAIGRATPDDMYNFAHSLRAFVESDQPLLDPSVTALRQAYYVNDVHPLIDLSRAILADAPSNEPLFNTMFLISEMPEFKDSVRLVSNLAKDGRLKELLSAILSIFHRFSAHGATAIHGVEEPAFVPRARHDLAEADLALWRPGAEPSEAVPACGRIDARVSLGDYSDGAAFDGQLGNYLACADSRGQYDDLQDAIRFLEGTTDERGKDYVRSTIDLLWALNMTGEELAYMGQSFLSAYRELRFSHALELFRQLIEVSIHGASDAGGEAGPVLRPLLDALGPLVGQAVRPGLHELENFAAGVLRRADFPSVLGYVDHLLDLKPEPPAGAGNSYDLARIKRWVGNKECASFPAHASEEQLDEFESQRAAQLTSDFDESITSWDLAINGQPRRDWEFGEFRSWLDDLVTKFGDPAQSVRPGAALDALSNSLRYFTLPKGQPPNEYQHYTIDELRKFVIDRSNDYQLMTYYYPGENTPRVRLVSTMDRLELVLVNADFWAPWPFVRTVPDFRNNRNFGLLFLSQIAEAWGDEPENVWPEEIRKKYAGSRPPTLAEAVASMGSTARSFEKLVGLADVPDCTQVADPNDPPQVQWAETHDPHQHGIAPSWMPAYHIPMMRKLLFNIHQALPVLTENLPIPGYPLGQGGRYVNGMRILRDLFFQLYYSTPEPYRRADFHNPADGLRNNLSIIMKLERAGFTRQLARHLRSSRVDDPDVIDFFNGIVAGATASDDPLATTPHPRYADHALFDPLVDPKYNTDPNKPHPLFWGIIQQIFSIIDAAEGHALDATHQAELQGLGPEEQAQVRRGWVEDFALMKQLGYYTVAAAAPMSLIRPAIDGIGPVLAQYNDFLARNTDKVETLLRSNRMAYFVRALYEDKAGPKAALANVLANALGNSRNTLDAMSLVQGVTDSPVARGGYDRFVDRWNALSSTQAYLDLHLDQVTRSSLDFLEMNTGDANGRGAARRMLDFVAERLEKQDLDQYLLLAAQHPDDFYRVLQALGHGIDDGDVGEFFQESYDALALPPGAGR